ncbi:hypothetical protein [Streptomyces sp. NPDC093109]|uniref:hypothetical protein n=1 Tax=Streptomyces sp. NPDC093109 TaxID=3154977 RepID=UPI00344F4390
MDAGDGGGRDYPPKTPPPPKKPVAPPFPNPPKPKGRVATRDRRRVMMANRRGANWPLERRDWTPAVARRRVLDRLREWGYQPAEDAVGAVVALLVETAMADGGTRVSLHLTDDEQRVLVLVLNHCPGMAPSSSDRFMKDLVALGVTECGTESGEDGRRLWALLDLRGGAPALPVSAGP